MNNTEIKIKNHLDQLKGKPADYVTRAFKEYSGTKDGTMVDGIINMIDELVADKKLSVEDARIKCGVGCFVGGTVMTAVLGGVVWLHSKREVKKEHQVKQAELVEILEKEVVRAKQGEVIDDIAETNVQSESDQEEE